MVKKSTMGLRERVVAVALAGTVLLSTPGAIQPVTDRAAVHSGVAYQSAPMPKTAAPLLGGELPRITPPPEPLSGTSARALWADAQKRVNVGPLLNWIWSNARHLWNGFADAVRWGWFTFSGYWWSLPGWIRGVATWFTGGSVWDIYVSLREYFFGW